VFILSSTNTQAFVYFARNLTRATYKQAIKIRNEINGIADFYILSYRQDLNLNNFEKEFAQNIIIVSRDTLEKNCADLNNKYSTSNDWKIMPGHLDLAQISLIKTIKEYNFYWFCEDDVRFGGDMSSVIELFKHNLSDLLCTNLRAIPNQWFFKNTYKNINNDTPKLLSFLPFFRISRAGINNIYEAYAQGSGGHHEISWPNILISNDFTVQDFHESDPMLYTSDKTRLSMGWGSFCYFPPKLFINEKSGLLYHPVKPLKEYFKMYKKFITMKIKKRIHS
jgi:hypothetical protein